jgi:DNA-binding NarL/FixJ family response regulator
MARRRRKPILLGMSESTLTRVVVAADRGTTRSSLWSLLEIEPGLEPVGVAVDLPTAIRQLRLLAPDVLLVSRRLLGPGGVHRLPALVLEAEGTAVVVIGMGDHPGLDALVRSTGAAGYMRLDEAAERMSGLVGLASGSRTVSVVPAPGADSIASAPPSDSTRSRIPTSP